jgi:integrase
MANFVIFKLKESQKGISPSRQKETPVNLFFSYGYYVTTPEGKREYTPLKISTGEKIKPCYWKDRPVYRAKQVKEIDYQSFNTVLDNIQGAVLKVYRSERANNRLPSPDQLRDLLIKELNLIPAKAVESLNDYIDRFNKEIENGERLVKRGEGTKYRSGTIRNYKSFKNQFEQYQKDRKKVIDFKNVDQRFYDDFVNYFVGKEQSPNNIGKHIKCLKSIMGCALAEKLHNNKDFLQKDFKAIRAKTEAPYLSLAEVEKLENLDLSENEYQEKIRDIFLIGCYTAQRFSDYSRIRKENIKTTSSGTRIIDLIQRKTGERVQIPLKPKLDNILRKYNYVIPKSFEQKVNTEIKKIARDAGITEIIPVKKIKGGKEVRKDYVKCDLISTHTARRTGATLMYLDGIPSIDIMKITGHQKESVFLNYIKVSKEETADSLADKPFFS